MLNNPNVFMNYQDIEKKHPTFFKTSIYLQNKAIFFQNSIPKLIEKDYDFELAERICKNGLILSSNDWYEYQKNLNNLIELSFDFLKLQVSLEKTGKYLYSSYKEVEKNLYEKNDGQSGPNYLWGLYFSEIFWKIHCKLTKFFLKDFVSKVGEEGYILEVPVGTGFHLSQFLLNKPQWIGLGIDIADSAVTFSKNILEVNNIQKTSYNITKKDFFSFDSDKKFDRIICGEFLEHVEKPVDVLNKLHGLLNKDGKIFLTAAVWAGGVDHIYLYTHPNEIRNQIKESKFCIENELVQAVLEKDEINPEKGKIPVNYAAILTK